MTDLTPPPYFADLNCFLDDLTLADHHALLVYLYQTKQTPTMRALKKFRALRGLPKADHPFG